MTPTPWWVAEFDRKQRQIALAGPYEVGARARARLDLVTFRSQRPDVVRRTRSAALLHDGLVVEARSVAPTRRAPWVRGERLRHLDPATLEQLHRLDVLASDVVLAVFRVDAVP